MSDNTNHTISALKGIEPLLKSRGFWLFREVHDLNKNGSSREEADIYRHDSGVAATIYESGPNAGKVELTLSGAGPWTPPLHILSNPVNLGVALDMLDEILAAEKKQMAAQAKLHPAQQQRK